MKKIILIALSTDRNLGLCPSPTYEPFTEFATAIAATGTNANESHNRLDLATGGYTAPGGEQWGVLISAAPRAAIALRGLPRTGHWCDQQKHFQLRQSEVLFPSGFPGIPSSGGIAIVENPAQPLLWFTNAQSLP